MSALQKKGKRTTGIDIASALMIVFGLTEVYTSFSHSFFGISTSSDTIAVYTSTLIGVFYIAAGIAILPMKRWGATLAILFLGLDIAARIFLVAVGLYPTNSFENIVGIVTGTIIAVIFALYIFLKWRSYD